MSTKVFFFSFFFGESLLILLKYLFPSSISVLLSFLFLYLYPNTHLLYILKVSGLIFWYSYTPLWQPWLCLWGRFEFCILFSCLLFSSTLLYTLKFSFPFFAHICFVYKTTLCSKYIVNSLCFLLFLFTAPGARKTD